MTVVIHELGLEEHQKVYNNTGANIQKVNHFTLVVIILLCRCATINLADATDENLYNAKKNLRLQMVRMVMYHWGQLVV